MWKGNTVLLPSPLARSKAIVELARTSSCSSTRAISLARMLGSLALAAALAIPLGIAMGLSRCSTDDLIDPTIEMLRPISGIAWIPLALFIFGIGNALPVFIMTYAAFFPILLGTVAGVRAVDRRLIDAARTMGVPRAHDRDARRAAGGHCRRCSSRCAWASRRRGPPWSRRS